MSMDHPQLVLEVTGQDPAAIQDNLTAAVLAPVNRPCLSVATES